MTNPPPSSPGPAAERITVRASTGVQGGGSLNFGKLVWLEGARLHVQVDCSLKPMDPVVLKVDLQPVPGNAMLHGTVMRALPTAQGEPTAYLVRLDSVASDDQVRWHQFLKVKRSGGTLSDLSDVHDGSGAMKATYSSVAERERRAALERMGGGVKHPSGVGGGATPSSAATWSSSSLSEGGGRAAMRDALKAALTRGSEAPRPAAASPAPSPNVPPAPPAAPATRYVSHANPESMGGNPRSTASTWSQASARPGTPIPTGIPSTSAHVPAPQGPAPLRSGGFGGPPAPPPPASPGTVVTDDPTWVASNLGGTTYVKVDWRTPEAFSFDVHTQLSAGVLTLNSDGRPLPQTGAIYFVLNHQGILVQAKGTVSEHRGFSATYRVELDASHIAELRRGARTTSTVSGVGSVDPGRRAR